jgi:hypothetical protein
MTKSQNSTRRPLADPILARYAKQIRAIAKRTVNDIVRIGELLKKAKKRLKHGDYLLWLDRELRWSADTAQNFVNVFELSCTSKFRKFRNLPTSALYLLAKKSTPEAARDAVAEQIEAGARITLSGVRDTVRIGPRYTVPEPQLERRSIGSAEHDAPTPLLKPLTAEVFHAVSCRKLIGLIVEVASQLPHDQSFEEASALVESVGDAEGMRERFSEAVAKLYHFIDQVRRAVNERLIDEVPARPSLRVIPRKDD